MLDKLSAKDLGVALQIAEQDHGCEGITCNDCPYTGKECEEEAHGLLAELLKAEIKRREIAVNRKKITTLEINDKVKEHLDRVIKAVKKLKSQQSNKTYRSKVTTGCVVVDTTVTGLSFKEVKILVDGE